MVFKTILNTTSQVPIYHPNRVVLNRVLDGTRIKDAIINHLVMCAFSLGDTLAMDMYVIILIIYFYYSGLSKTAKNDKKS